MIQNYFLYHLHSDLSNGTTNVDSVTKYKDYIAKAKECGMTALAFSEHGNIFEWHFKKRDIEAAGMKYVHAVEAYITEDEEDSLAYFAKVKGKKTDIEFSEIWEKDGITYGLTVPKKGEIEETLIIKPETLKTEQRKTRDNYHCVLIARNYEGVLEINRLMSNAYNRDDNHFYYYPRIRFSELINTSDNVVITTACLGGILHAKSPLKHSTIKERFISFLQKNKHRCYLEIQHHDCDEQAEYNELLVKLHEVTGIPLIVGTDTHALNEQQMKARHILQLGKGVHFDNEDDWDLSFKTADELIEAYEEQDAVDMDLVLEAMQNSLDLADSIETFELDKSPKFPKLHEDSEAVFKQRIREGIENLKLRDKPNWPEYKERIKTEYDIYKHNGAIDFMLLEDDYKNALVKQGVYSGPSRGSVSGSIIANLLNITYVDSIEHKLNFERFMHNERISLPDIDSDWFADDKEKVKDYLYNREGLYCAEIVTFNTIARKGAIDTICKGMFCKNEDDKEYLNIAEKIKNVLCQDDEDSNKPFDLDKVKKSYPDIYKKYSNVLEYVNDVINVIVSVGNHPAATIVSPFPINEKVGLFTTSSCPYPVSILYMKEIDDLNYVKLDVLGLDNVGLISKTCELAGIERLTPRNCDFTDEKVWKDMADDAMLIFQFESDLAAPYLKELLSDSTVNRIKKVDKDFSYLKLASMGTAALRPAGESYRNKLVKGIFKSYGFEPLDEFMAPSLGYMIYQETIMNFLNKFCGFTMGQADMVRRGLAKKVGTEQFIPQIKTGFIKYMKETYNEDESESERIIVDFLKVIQDASNYAFSENHAIPYTMISYMCGWLRYYYKLEFVTTALNIFHDKTSKFIEITNYAKRSGFVIKDAKFRYSKGDYLCDAEKSAVDIYKGIASIKTVNGKAADELYTLRENSYNSFMELLIDIKAKKLKEVKKNMLIALIKINFFEEFGDPNFLLEQLYLFDKFYEKKTIKKNGSQFLPDEKKKEFFRFTYDSLIPAIKAASLKESATQYSIDANKFLLTAVDYLVYEPQSPKEIILAELEYFGYVNYQNPKMANMAIVIDKTKKKTPVFKVYSIKNGTTMNCKIEKARLRKKPVEKENFLKITGVDYKGKWITNDEGKWERSTTDKEMYLEHYEVIESPISI